MKIKIIFTLLFLAIFKINYAQQKLTTEDLFKEYLISQNASIAKSIVASNDNLYSIFCEADLTNNSEKKIAGFSKFIDLSPKYGLAKAYESRGIAYIYIEKTDAALADLNKSLQLDPADPYTFYFKGDAYMDLKKLDSAIDNFNYAIKLDPNFSLAYHLRGIAFDDQKKYQNALDDFTKEIKLDKKSDIAYKMRGFVYNEMGKYKLAIDDWRKAEKLNPDNYKHLDDFIDKAMSKLRNE